MVNINQILVWMYLIYKLRFRIKNSIDNVNECGTVDVLMCSFAVLFVILTQRTKAQLFDLLAKVFNWVGKKFCVGVFR